MPTKFQIKRTSVSGRTPNTTNSGNAAFIAAGELAVNLTDQKVFSSNGTLSFEVGANLSNLAVNSSITIGNSTVNTTVNSSSIAVTKIIANGNIGTSGQVLIANTSGGLYWGSAYEPKLISDVFTGNGSNTVFTLSVQTKTEKTFVFLNGVQQIPGTDYSVSYSTLTFVLAPANLDEIAVRTLQIEGLSDVDITSDSFVANGSNTQFTLGTSLSSDAFSFVFLNGVAQVPTVDYTISGSTLTFTTAPPISQQINVTSLNAIDEFVLTTYTANGTANQFALPHQSSTKKTIVSLNGIAQAPITDYNIVGSTLNFASPPANNDKVIIRSIYSVEDASGANTTIQYNKSGDLAGSAGFTFNETTNNVNTSSEDGIGG